MSTTRMVSRTEAARLCHVSKDTICRRQSDNSFPNAEETTAGWMIPVSDLVAAGLLDPYAGHVAAPGAPDTDLEHRVEELSRQLDREREEVQFLRATLRDALGRAA